jgi:hypothetical protein
MGVPFHRRGAVADEDLAAFVNQPFVLSMLGVDWDGGAVRRFAT